MRKIPTLLVRDPEDRRHVTDEITEGCEWVLAGEGVATRKYDGTCVMLDDSGSWWARREVKPGKGAPDGFVLVEHDETTGKSVGWEPIEQSPFQKFWSQAAHPSRPGTYELVGPKVNGNHERQAEHVLVEHAAAQVLPETTPRTVATVTEQVRALGSEGVEGIVWHHPDGRMAKLKARDLRPETPAP